MRRILATLLLVSAGCAYEAPYALPTPGMPPYGTGGGCVQNPVFLPESDHARVWEAVVEVVDDYFQIEREEPVRQIGAALTEGRLDTFPQVGSTLFEPWRGDSASPEERLESTLQSIRRYAQIKVSPAQGGYWVEVAVHKELEDVVRPTHSTAGAATFRNDSSLTRVADNSGDQQIHQGWIPLGRDAALEQRILAQLQSQLGASRRGLVTLQGY